MNTYDPMPSFIKRSPDGKISTYTRPFETSQGIWLVSGDAEAWSPSRWNVLKLLRAWRTAKRVDRDVQAKHVWRRETVRRMKVMPKSRNRICGREGNVIFRYRIDLGK